MTMVIRFLSIILVAELLIGCPNTQNAGGTSTTENFVQVRLVSDSLQQPTSARVRFFDEDSWYQSIQGGINPVVNTTQVDSTGIFTFPADSNCVVMFSNDLGETALSRCRDLNVAGGDYVLSRGRSVLGIVYQNDSMYKVTKAWIEGSDLSVDVVDGVYLFDSVPRGNQRIVLQLADQTEDLIAANALPVEGNVEDTLQLFGGRILLEDFEDGNSQGLMKRYFPNGAYWWQSVTGSAVLTPKVDRNADYIAPSDGWRGGGLNVIMSASGTDHAIIGLDLGQSKTATVSKGEYNLTKMHSIHFMAKGNGSINVQLSTGWVNDSVSVGTFSVKLTLTDVWTRYEITPSDLLPAPAVSLALPGYTWADAAERVSSIEFVTMNDSVHLQLDELIIEGVSPLDLFGF